MEEAETTVAFEITELSNAAKLARMTGALYLMFILASLFADTLGHIGLGNSPQIYRSIMTSLGTFRVAVVLGFASAFFFLMAAWGLYVLFRAVNAEMALLFLLLNAAGVAVQCASLLWLVSAMVQGDLATGVSGVSTVQAHAFTLASIDTYRTGFVTAQLFFGTWLFPLGYLVLKSGLLPRFLGLLLILDGVAELIWFLQGLLLPEHSVITYPGTAVSLVAEVGLTLWLLVRGVKVGGGASGVPPAPATSSAGHKRVR